MITHLEHPKQSLCLRRDNLTTNGWIYILNGSVTHKHLNYSN